MKISLKIFSYCVAHFELSKSRPGPALGIGKPGNRLGPQIFGGLRISQTSRQNPEKIQYISRMNHDQDQSCHLINAKSFHAWLSSFWYDFDDMFSL